MSLLHNLDFLKITMIKYENECKIYLPNNEDCDDYAVELPDGFVYYGVTKKDAMRIILDYSKSIHKEENPILIEENKISNNDKKGLTQKVEYLNSNFSKDELILSLQNKARELKRIPTHDEIISPSYRTYYRVFGSWKKAIIEADLHKIYEIKDVQGIPNDEGLLKTDIGKLTKRCAYCNNYFRIDKVTHYKEKSSLRPKRIHKEHIKEYIKNKYDILQSELCDYINENYELINYE